MELNRWQSFAKKQQFLTISAEFARAKNWQYKDQEKFLLALERALELIDLTLADLKWRNSSYVLLRLQEEVAKFYTSQRTDDISVLSRAL